MKRQSGFTLIELIIVIVILGILAVTAAPQFFNFGGDARESTVRGLEGSIKAGADIVYARSAVEGIESRETVSPTNAGVDVIYGYPTADSSQLTTWLNINLEDWVIDDSTSHSMNGETRAAVRIAPRSAFDSGTDFDDLVGCTVTYGQAVEDDPRSRVEVDVTSC